MINYLNFLRCFASLSKFDNIQATVTGPTPPGTGVIHRATRLTANDYFAFYRNNAFKSKYLPSKSTSPANDFLLITALSVQFFDIPTSITIASCLIIPYSTSSEE